jgi:hypothetical protein
MVSLMVSGARQLEMSYEFSGIALPLMIEWE